MALNYAGLHLVAENFVTRPKSNQPYTNKLAESIHGASAYVIPHKVENRHRQQIEALCGSPQIQRIRTIMANSRASFGASVAAPTSAPPLSPPAAIPPTPKQAKSAAKQESRNLSVEAQEAKAQMRQAKAEGEAAVAEARRLSTAKKAAKTPTAKERQAAAQAESAAAKSSAKSGLSSAGFVTAKGSAKTAKKVAFTTATPSAVRALAKDFDGEAEAPPNVGGGGSAAAAAPSTPSAASGETASRADSINEMIAQVDGAAGRVKVVPTSKEGKGAKGFQPAYIGDDGVARGYKSADVTEDHLEAMIREFTKVRARLTDKKQKQDITNFISRIKAEKDSR